MAVSLWMHGRERLRRLADPPPARLLRHVLVDMLRAEPLTTVRPPCVCIIAQEK
jgi:hypothetical protein